MKQIFILLCMCGKKKNIKQQFKIKKNYIYQNTFVYILHICITVNVNA